MTVLEVIQKSTGFLATKGVDSPRLQAELLLAQVLNLPRMKLYLNFERTLTPQETDAVRELVKRRGRREPLQHITGSTSFCGLEIAVNGHVLVPRPETELLAETGWKFLLTFTPRNPTALDFGTGSGCIAIAVALKCPAAVVVASDVSPQALDVARQNAVRHNLDTRIIFHLGDGLATLPVGTRFDLILSNPPYIPSSEIQSLQPEVRDHDPRAALDGGTDGLVFYRRLAAEAATFLLPGGKIMLEFGDGQADAIHEIFIKQLWIVEAVLEDYTQRPRDLDCATGVKEASSRRPAAVRLAAARRSGEAGRERAGMGAGPEGFGMSPPHVPVTMFQHS